MLSGRVHFSTVSEATQAPVSWYQESEAREAVPRRGHYQVILADPPWDWRSYSKKGQGRSASAYYDTMSIDEIKRVPVGDWAAKDAVLFLWELNSMRGAADQVIEAWGFRYSTVGFTWVKWTPRDRGWHFGMGYWTRQNTERCLLAVRGKCPRRLSRSQREVIIAPVRRHSVKPDEIYERIEALVGGPYLELFGRQ
jgi:N6-adenosine-specific RNA methylase IME4